MEKRQLTKEDLDKVRDIEGFPIGTDEDIIALSDPPYYTACPNPFIADFIKEHGTPYDEETDNYHREPFAADVSEGKNDPLYNAHTYHTKVPYKAVMQYILHYTNPNDIVFDGFCGAGMTGLAAKMCSKSKTYLNFATEPEDIRYGIRYAILNDLGVAASFISSNYALNNDIEAFRKDAMQILQFCKEKYSWMYETQHYDRQGKKVSDVKGRINYTVWSDVFICPNCSSELVFYDIALDAGHVKSEFHCPHCEVKLKKTDCIRAVDTYYDSILDEEHTINKQIPVLINYSVGNRRYEKKPDADDYQLLKKIDSLLTNVISYPMMNKGGKNWAEIYRAGYHNGYTHSHHFYTKRNYLIISEIWNRSTTSMLKWSVTSVLNYINKKQSFTGGGGGMPGVLYIASLVQEKNVFDVLERKVKALLKTFENRETLNSNIISTGSSTDLSNIMDNSIDYVFIDPPFGSNIMYSEASFLWECWLKVFTNQMTEAIESKYQNKSLFDYQYLMSKCFKEFYRILKPNRWMTVEFHNSKNAVWNVIQQSLLQAGFVIADVRTLDKQQGSFKQVTTVGAVKQDLVISAYKPKNSLLREFAKNAGTEETAWAFVRQHLSNLPIAVDANKNGKLDMIPERQAFLLFDRMVAYHIMQGLPVPIDASAFYKGLDDRFLKRDNMYFLPDQVNEYDLARSKCEIENVDISLFVTDEKSAIGWLYQQLDEKNGGKPQTYQVLQPKFMQEVKAVKKNEKLPELSVLLEENFLKDEKGRWYVPDITKSGDIAKLREKNLLREFQEYQATKGKLKVFRSEAIRAGFAKLWKEKDYKAIVTMAERLPEETVQEDQNILMYYDISLSRV